VLLARMGLTGGITIVVLVSAYEAGDFMVGSDARTRWEGPLAGVIAVAVCTFPAWVLALPPLGAGGSIAVGAIVALLAPLGPPTASALLGSEGPHARFVRRLDTLLVLGPVVALVAPLFEITTH
jgi:hypothetical protein